MQTFRRLLVLVAFVALLVLGWRFAGTNLQPVTVSYFFGTIEVSLWQALLSAFGVGFAIAAIAGLYQGARLSLTARRWRKVAQGLEGELHQLRNLPLAAPSEKGRGAAGASGAFDPPARDR